MTLDEAIETLRKEWRNDPRLREAIQIVGARAQKPTMGDVLGTVSVDRKGARCPCCGRLCKIYKRKLYGVIGCGLITLVKLWKQKQDWVHRTELGAYILKNGGDFSKLEWWGLAEQKVNESTKKRCSGLWRPTTLGVDFVYGKVAVPSHAFEYRSKPQGFTDEQVTIRDVLGSEFDYGEMMAAT